MKDKTPENKLTKTCTNIDCPERTGGKCTAGKTPESWRERFEKEFAIKVTQGIRAGEGYVKSYSKEIKSFIQSEIDSAVAETRASEQARVKEEIDASYKRGYEKGIDKTLQAIRLGDIKDGENYENWRDKQLKDLK